MVWLLSLILCVTTFLVSQSALADSAPLTIKNQSIYIAQAVEPQVYEHGEIWKQSSPTFTAQGSAVPVYHGNLNEEDKAIWTLENGSGKRQFVSHVDFDEWYQKKPTVIVSLAGFDSTGRKAISVKAININERGFDLVLTTLGQSQVSSLWVNWVAFGNND